jgi:hypothetical protein
MACVINVDWSNTKGIKIGGSLDRIHVEGSAQGCGSVEVTLTCGSVALPPVKVPVGATGVWSVNIVNLPSACQCGDGIRVEAACADGVQTCANSDANVPQDLVCTSQPPVVATCPTIVWGTKTVGACDANGNSTVTVTASVVGPSAATAELRDPQGNMIDTGTGSGQFPLQGSFLQPGGTTQSVTVVVTAPTGCGGGVLPVSVPACEEPPMPGGSGRWRFVPGGGARKPDGNGGGAPQPDGNGGGGACGSMVWIVGTLSALLAALLALTLAWWLCVPGTTPPAWVWGIVIGVGVANATAIAAWYLLCVLIPSCECPSTCDWLQIGTMTAVASFAILAWLSTCCPTIWLAAGFGAAYATAAIAWAVSCKPSWCTALAAHLAAIVSGTIPAIAYIAFVPQIAACGSTSVNAVIATTGGLLAAATAAVCAKAAASP